MPRGPPREVRGRAGCVILSYTSNTQIILSVVIAKTLNFADKGVRVRRVAPGGLGPVVFRLLASRLNGFCCRHWLRQSATGKGVLCLLFREKHLQGSSCEGMLAYL